MREQPSPEKPASEEIDERHDRDAGSGLDLRKHLYGFLKDIQAEFDCDEEHSGNDHERWAMPLTFAPVWSASKQSGG